MWSIVESILPRAPALLNQTMFSLSLLPAALLGPFVLSVYFLLAYVNWRLAVRRRRRRNSRVSAFVGRRTELNAPPQQRLAIDLEKNKNDGLEFDSRLSLEMTLSPDLSVSGCCGRPDVGWTWDVVASPDGTGQLFIRSHLVGHPLLSYEIGAGGCVNRITDLVRNVELVPPAVNPLVQNDRMGTMLVTWSNGLAVSVPHLADQRWNMNMGGSRDELAPVIAVTLGEGYLDVFTLLRDQFSPLLKDRMKTLVAGRIRYKMKQNSPVLEIQRTLVFGETIVDGRERKLTGMCGCLEIFVALIPSDVASQLTQKLSTHRPRKLVLLLQQILHHPLHVDRRLRKPRFQLAHR